MLPDAAEWSREATVIGMRAIPAGGYKLQLIEGLFAEFGGRPARVLDLGCGTAANFEKALRRHPHSRTRGVEQNREALAQANDLLGGSSKSSSTRVLVSGLAGPFRSRHLARAFLST